MTAAEMSWSSRLDNFKRSALRCLPLCALLSALSGQKQQHCIRGKQATIHFCPHFCSNGPMIRLLARLIQHLMNRLCLLRISWHIVGLIGRASLLQQPCSRACMPSCGPS